MSSTNDCDVVVSEDGSIGIVFFDWLHGRDIKIFAYDGYSHVAVFRDGHVKAMRAFEAFSEVAKMNAENLTDGPRVPKDGL